MKRSILLTALQTLLITTAMAQSLKTPTLEDLIPGGETYRFAENLPGLQWQGERCVKPTTDTLFAIHPATGKQSIIATRQAVNQQLEAAQMGKLSHFYNVSFPYPDKEKMLIRLSGKYIVYDVTTQQISDTLTLRTGAANQDYSATGGRVAYTIDNNLYVNNTRVTNEPTGIVCGQSVHRNEFGIRKGTFWSPTGNLLAFYRMDESMVAEYPLVDIAAAPIAQVSHIRYPMAGQTSHRVTIGIYNPANGNTLYLKAGDPTDRYFTNINWAPDEQSLYLIELNRDQNHAKLCQYNALTGELMQTLFEEKHPRYVEPQHAIVFLPWDASQFIYQSQSNGFSHLYLYNTEGKQLKQLTDGAWLVQEFLGFDARKRELIIAGTACSPLQSNLFRINMKSGKRTLIGNSEGVHRATLSPSGQYVIDSYSSPTTPRSISIVETQSSKSISLLTAKDPYADLLMPSIETGTIKAADGVTDLYYRLIKPTNFDSTKKYPTIIYTYGGPHAQTVNNGWQNGARGWDLHMANKGYVMFTIDNRGSSNRGLEFENVTFRNLGIEEGKDQVKGAEFLQSLPYVDGTRIGVHGWSYGGHMTTALMLRYPDVFKVGVAGGPVIDWSYYEVMYGERYMDTPQSNPEGYKQGNLKNLAGNLKGHLLMIHDDHDDTCVPQHTLSFMKACVDARTYPDLFLYPGHKHNVSGRDRIHLHEKITRYFEANL